MTEIIRKDTDYAMRLLVCLASNETGIPVAAKTLAASQDIPQDFAYKILRKMTRAGLVRGHMGSQGGFELARRPDEITFLQVISAIQGPVSVRRCCLDITACPRHGSCNISLKLGELQDSLVNSLQSLTLSDAIRAKNFKLS